MTTYIMAEQIAKELRDLAHDSRLRQAIVVTAVLKGGPLEVTHGDCFDAARFNVKVLHGATEMIVSLVDAPNN